MTDAEPGTLRSRLESDARTAMKARDKTAVAALRALIGALDNASAVAAVPQSDPIVNRRADVPRRELTADDIRNVVSREVAEVRSAIDEYSAMGRLAEAEALRAKLTIMVRYAEVLPTQL